MFNRLPFFPEKPALIVGLDIGTAKVAAVVGEINESGGLSIIGLGQCPSRGVRKGEIVNADRTAEDVRNAIVDAEKSADVEIRSVYLGVSGAHLAGEPTHGDYRVAADDHEISAHDVTEVIAAAKVFKRPSENTVLHAIRQHFTVNGQPGIADPVGMLGSRLEVDMHVIHGVTSRLQNPVRLVKGLQLEVEELVFNGLATSLAVLTTEQKEMGTLVVNLGAGTTDYVVYAGGNIRHTGVLAVGGDHLTNDLTHLRVSTPRAEALKREHGAASAEDAGGPRSLTLTNELGFLEKRVNLDHLRRIMAVRLEETFQFIDDDLGERGLHDQLRAGICLCGGGARIRGLQALAERVFGLPAFPGRGEALSGLRGAVDDPELATAVGLVRYGAIRLKSSRRPVSLLGRLKNAGQLFGLL